jgi:hypothetical protein
MVKADYMTHLPTQISQSQAVIQRESDKSVHAIIQGDVSLSNKYVHRHFLLFYSDSKGEVSSLIGSQ